MSEPVQPTPGPNPTPIEPAAKVEPVAPVTLPDDHPLVKALAAQKDEIKRLKTVVDGSKTEAEKVADKLAEYEQKVSPLRRAPPAERLPRASPHH